MPNETTTTTTTPAVAGIDVSKARLDVHILPDDRRLQVPNTPEGHATLTADLTACGCTLAILEATGGYEHAAAAALQAASVPVRIIGALQARRLAQGMDPKGAKTDAIDAELLARMAAIAPHLGLRVRPVAAAEREEFHSLVERRRQLVSMVAQEKPRLQQARTPKVKADIEAIVSMLREHVKAIDRETSKAVLADEALKAAEDLLKSVPGVGPVTARVLLAEMPELGKLTNRQAASLAGLAPVPKDSGTKKGARHIAAGRSKVRRALYMAAVSAMRTSSWSGFYTRLKEAGKPSKVCLVALMRKLLVAMNAILRDGTPWNPEKLQKALAA